MTNSADIFSDYDLVVSLLDTGLWRNRRLTVFFRKKIKISVSPFGHKSAVHIGWGRKPSGLRAAKRATRAGQRYLLLEDGFLRSTGLSANAPLLSLITDDLGIYYDATQPSRLERLIAEAQFSTDVYADALRALALVTEYQLTKYNHAPDWQMPEFPPGTEHVLVIDQTYGDASVSYGGADAGTFQTMLMSAVSDNPHAQLWVKTHPDVLAGIKKGYLDQCMIQQLDNKRVHLLAEDVSPLSLLSAMDKVYVVTSQMGFEALMLKKQVVCFGLPWYAGWGLTEDRHPDIETLRIRRHTPRTLEQLFAAMYLQYTRYLNPETGQRGTIFDVIAWLQRNKTFNNATRGTLYCVGMSRWKQASIRPFLEGVATRIHFVETLVELESVNLPPDAKIVIWGSRDIDDARALSVCRQIPLWRMEDGFLRSVGLGSDLFRPVSLVLDKGGIYYDPASTSDLEHILLTQTFSADELAQAQTLRDTFVRNKVSKYNVGRSQLTINAEGRRVLLVPGQVEDDASVFYGSPLVPGNQALLETVRKNNPDAYIMYKPHPDVVAGNRRGNIEAHVLARLADQYVLDANIIDCILAADEVHTMTSLSGFEALLHGRVVHCYGGPFYAGWGLTTDHMPLPRRTRTLSLNTLIYAAMVVYPRYVIPQAPVRGFTSVHRVIQWLSSKPQSSTQQLGASGLRGKFERWQRKSRALFDMAKESWRMRK